MPRKFRHLRTVLPLGLVVLVAFAASPGLSQTAASADAARDLAEQLWRHRNLGKAFYENSATQYQAIDEFAAALALAPESVRERINYGLSLLRAGREEEGIAELEKAQKQDPSVPHTWFNLGIAYKRASRYDDALAQLQGMVERVPDEAKTHYNLGVLHKLRGDGDRAVEHFRRAAELDPNLAGPHFQLATAYRQRGDADASRAAMTEFRRLKEQNQDAAVPEDLEWGWYSEIYDEPAEPEARAPLRELAFAVREVASVSLDPASAGLHAFDADASAELDLVAWDRRAVWIVGVGDAPAQLAEATGTRGVASCDLDDDGDLDLVRVAEGGASVWTNDGGVFAASPGFGELGAGDFRFALCFDYDHDYDLDVALFGKEHRLLRNQGEKGWADRTADFPFHDGEATAGAVFDVVADSQGIDLAVSYREGGGALYRDLLGGRYEIVRWRGLPSAARTLHAADLDHDGWTDLLAVTDERTVLLRNGRSETFAPTAWPAGVAAPLTLADLGSRGVLDAVTPAGVRTLDGGGVASAAARLLAKAGAEGASAASALVAGDFDGDGVTDLAWVGADGVLRIADNRSAAGRWLRVDLAGVKNLERAQGAEVEVKAGSHYQKRLYDGTPLVFGLGAAAEVDTVRITWPNGLIQNESRQPAGAHRFEEAQRLSGSCPMIFTWNGTEHEFVTDVLGVAPLGAAAGEDPDAAPGSGGRLYFPVDHDEVIQIGGDQLVPRTVVAGEEGPERVLDVRITEELREVAFLDQVRLTAVDRPANLDVFVASKFKGPPFPEERIYLTADRHRPVAAVDHRGVDHLEKILTTDATYADGFERYFDGTAELHALTLDFGPTAGVDLERALLVLSGWVDWADGSTFLGVSQRSDAGLLMPTLEVRDASGRWVPAVGDMGLPAGKPKTIVVELASLADLDLGARLELRITTNLCLFWDEIFLARDMAQEVDAEGGLRRTDLFADVAEIRFRGFARPVIHPRREQPERFVYADVRPWTMWNPTRGLYTRYGAVGPLLEEVDDRFVIMGSGDEILLLFAADRLPPLPAGWTRDYLLKVDGWAKDGDANTAHSQTVGPLPFHGMSQYPYPAGEAFPDDPARTLWREHYNTRRPLRLIRPLAAGSPAKPEAPAAER